MALLDYVEIREDSVEITECVGAGRFGSVYKGKWNGMVVAVKKTLCFHGEAQLLASVRHRNIITFYGACTALPNSFILTEYAELGSLFRYLEEYTLEIPRVVEWATHIAAGTKYLHEDLPQCIIHRDLKSLNVLVCKDKQLKLCDFGSSRVVGLDSTVNTCVGTFKWMSPEMIKGAHVTSKADIWSLGVVLWELLTQEVPYGDMDGLAVAFQVVAMDLRLPIPSHTPPAFAELLTSCMRFNADERPTAGVLLAKLEAMKSDAQSQAQWEEFSATRPEWEPALGKALEAFSSLHTDMHSVASRSADLDKREAELAAREQAFSDLFTKGARLSGAPPVVHWAEEQVALWITKLPPDLAVYEERFRTNNIDGEILVQLTDSMMQDALCITSLGHRRRLLRHIREIQLHMEFPPLSRASQAPAPERTIDLTLCYAASLKSKVWSVAVYLKEDYDYIKEVTFVVARPSAAGAGNKMETCSRGPFRIDVPTMEKGRLEVTVAVTYRSSFHRKTTKRTLPLLCGAGSPDLLISDLVRLQPKHTHRQALGMPPSPSQLSPGARA